MSNPTSPNTNGNTAARPPKPSVISRNLDGIAGEMKAVPRWVLWGYAFVNGRWAKTPYQHGDRLAKTNDPATWQTFDLACRRLSLARGRNLPPFDGLGFVIGDGWAGVDLDDCILPDGSLEPWAAAIVEEFATYAEVSPSGTGLKLFCRGALPANVKAANKTGGKSSTLDGQSLGGGTRAVELYWLNKYFCVTGCRWPDLAPVVFNPQAVTA